MDPNHPDRALVRMITAVLFMHADPLPLPELAGWMGVPETEIATILDQVADVLRPVGLDLLQIDNHVALSTATDLDLRLRELLEAARTEPEPLSHGAWETLAIVAYKQPITRLEVEAFRQAGSERSLATLQDRGLIEEVGRKESPGRPILYGTTAYFLRQMGLADLDHLPPLMTPPAEPDHV